MELALTTAAGERSKSVVEVSDEAFNCAFNEALIHQVVTAYLAAARAGTRAQKSRADVSGGGRKPWRQKGTGQARSGTIRSPLWRGGGKTFAAQPASYRQKVNKKMYRSALRSIVSELVRQERLVVVEEFAAVGGKTKDLVGRLKALGLAGDVLIVADSPEAGLYLAARNLRDVEVADAVGVDPVSLVGHDKVVMTVGAVKRIEERLA